jgi:hypothetical protein
MQTNPARLNVLMAGAVFSLATAGFSQTAPPVYPKLILVVTDVSAQPERQGMVQTLSRLKRDVPSLNWIGGTVSVGNTGRPMAMFPVDRYADAATVLQQVNAAVKAVAKEMRPELQSALYELDREASFDGSRIPWREATALGFSNVLLRRGATETYREQQVLAAQLLTEANITDEVWIGYQVRFGAQAPAYLFVSPMRSVADLDVDMSGRPRLFTPDQLRARRDALQLSVISDTQWILDIDSALSKWP